MKRYRPLFSETHPYYIEKYVDKRASQRSNFYKNLKEGEEIPWGPTYKPLFEAVIRSDRYVSIVINEFRKLLQENNGKKFRFVYDACLFLTNTFSKYNFEFIEKYDTDNNYQSGIDKGATTPGNLKIIFFCNASLGDLFTNKELQKRFLIDFDEILGHELIHRGQFLNVQGNKLRAEIFKLKPDDSMGNDYNKEMHYYSRKGEIMAYAWMIIEELRFNGYTTDKILNIIKNNIPTENESVILEQYRKLFTIDDVQLKRLYKYIMVYWKLQFLSETPVSRLRKSLK